MFRFQKRSYSAHLWILMITSMAFVATILSLNNFGIHPWNDNHYFNSFILIQWMQKTSNSTGSGKSYQIYCCLSRGILFFYFMEPKKYRLPNLVRILWGNWDMYLFIKKSRPSWIKSTFLKMQSLTLTRKHKFLLNVNSPPPPQSYRFIFL